MLKINILKEEKIAKYIRYMYLFTKSNLFTIV